MRRWLWIGFGALALASTMAGAYVMLTPKIGHATRAEIEAVLPPSLKVEDAPDPQGTARFEKLAAVLRGLGDREIFNALGTRTKPADPSLASAVLHQERKTIAQIEALIDAGSLRFPDDDALGFGSLTNLRTFAKLLQLGAKDAVLRGDRRASGRYGLLGLQFSQALTGAGGSVMDQIVAGDIEASLIRTAYDTDTAGGFDAPTRDFALRLLAGWPNTVSALASSIRRDFRSSSLPFLLPTERSSRGPEIKMADYGTFDPIATARLEGRIYDAAMRDVACAPGRQSRLAERLAEEAGRGLPEEGTGPLAHNWYRFRMNLGRNTIGRAYASLAPPGKLPEVAWRQAAEISCLRAAILLRMGRPVNLPDPCGQGGLKIDAKRRIVWSVGVDGKDNGGDVPTGSLTKWSDIGWHY